MPVSISPITRISLALVVLIAGGLVLDASGLGHAQAVVAVMAWAMFAFLMLRSEPELRTSLLLCLGFATAGEVFLSLVWGLYDYRLGNLPAFVPPGHVLLFWLGLQLSPQIPPRAQLPLALFFVLVTGCAALWGHDLLSLPLLVLYLLCLRFGPSPRLYSTMFALALTMELWGTWLGNWAWRSTVPWLGLGSGNPPLAAGAFYCALDLLVLASQRALRCFRARRDLPSALSLAADLSENATD